jgi:hypothetical protein
MKTYDFYRDSLLAVAGHPEDLAEVFVGAYFDDDLNGNEKTMLSELAVEIAVGYEF